MYNEQTFRIEPRKVITVDDVRHEVDLHVTIDLGAGYTSVFIFECKNWVESIGKNEIIIFSEKVNVTRAQKGFFVAREFTRDAIAQAAKDPRIQLRRASDLSDSLVDLVNRLHFLMVEGLRCEASFTMLARDGRKLVPHCEVARIETPMGNESLRDFVNAAGADLSEKSLATFPSGQLAPELYDVSGNGRMEFAQSRIDGIEVRAIDLEVVTRVRVARPAVVSQYEVDSRGRVVWLEPVDFRQVALGPKLVSVPDPLDPEKHRVSIQIAPGTVPAVLRLSEAAVGEQLQVRLSTF